MLWASSLRRIAHSTSLRATGSLIAFCRSAAWVVFPLRAAAIASFKAAMSAADGKSLGASADRVGRAAAWGAASGVRGVMPAFAGAFSGRGLGSGALPAGGAASAATRPPPARRPAKNGRGVGVFKWPPLIVPPRSQYRRTITPDRGEKAAGIPPLPLGGFLRSRLPVNNVLAQDASFRLWTTQL